MVIDTHQSRAKQVTYTLCIRSNLNDNEIARAIRPELN